MKQLLFLCISLAILLFAVIVTNVAPIIKGKVGGNWSYYACKIYSDYYDLAKKDNDYDDSKAKDKYLDKIKKEKTRCDRRKAMNGLEYVVSNLNIIFGFVCAFTGFLLYQNIGNLGSDGKYIGLIGLGCGVVGFVLTLVYVIESGLVFTDVDGEIYDFFQDINGYYYTPYHTRIDSDGAYLEWDSGKKRYTCIFYKEDKEDSLYRRFSDYGNKYLNYYKDIKINDNSDKYNKYNGCTLNLGSYDLYELCYALSKETDQEIEGRIDPNNYDNIDYTLNSLIKNIKQYYKDQNDHSKTGDCEKIYYGSYSTANGYKVTYDYWLTSLIFSCLIMVLYIGLALFGFLLFKDGGSSSSSGPVSIK